jgi:hypothetical protein
MNHNVVRAHAEVEANWNGDAMPPTRVLQTVPPTHAALVIDEPQGTIIHMGGNG